MTPKYSAIDILLWLVLTDPDVLRLKPATLVLRILDNDKTHFYNCWKCLTIFGMSALMRGSLKGGVKVLQAAVNVAIRDTGSAPEWLKSRIEIAQRAMRRNW